ncbi:MAG: hypothetical protein MJ252_04580 [archaeon]|nr:hypothetical protein [archaeon]
MEDQEKEMKLIQEALQSGNIDILKKNLVFKNNPIKKVTQAPKVPKSLSKEEIEKRQAKKFAKEVDELAKIQQKLFAQSKRGKPLIEPIKKTKTNFHVNGLYNNDPNKGIVVENKLLKECREVFSKEYKEDKKNDVNEISNSNKMNSSKNTSKTNINKNQPKPNLTNNSFRKTNQKQRMEIDCKEDKNLTADQKSDIKFVKEMTKGEINFYMENNEDLFKFLKNIYLVRFIEKFIAYGFESPEDLYEIEENFFELTDKPFLNKEQITVLFKKINEVAGKNLPLPVIENKTETENKSIIKENSNKSKSNIKIDEDELNTSIRSKIGQAQKNFDDYLKSNSLNESGLENKSNTSFTGRKELPPIVKSNTSLKNLKTKKEVSEFGTDPISTPIQNKKEKKKVEMAEGGTSPIKEKKTAEGGTDAMDGNDDIEIKLNITHTKEFGVNAEGILMTQQDDIICCWNCFKHFTKEDCLKYHLSTSIGDTLKEDKYFCSKKCCDEYEKGLLCDTICFNCEKHFDMSKGFILYGEKKFCTGKCKKQYLKKIKMEKLQNSSEKSKEEVTSKSNEDKEDSYDPMEDF